MYKIGESIRIDFVYPGWGTGKIVQLLIEKPDGTIVGPLVLIEKTDPDFKGVYYRDYVPDIPGKYLFLSYAEDGSKRLERAIVENYNHDDLKTLLDSIKVFTEFCYHESSGGWKFDYTLKQYVLMKADNVTEIARFDLFDSLGNPTVLYPMERKRV